VPIAEQYTACTGRPPGWHAGGRGRVRRGPRGLRAPARPEPTGRARSRPATGAHPGAASCASTCAADRRWSGAVARSDPI